jgi:hypothetical protein
MAGIVLEDNCHLLSRTPAYWNLVLLICGLDRSVCAFLRLQKSDGFQPANFGLDPDRILELFVRKIVLAQQVNILPGHDRAVCDGLE